MTDENVDMNKEDPCALAGRSPCLPSTSSLQTKRARPGDANGGVRPLATTVEVDMNEEIRAAGVAIDTATTASSPSPSHETTRGARHATSRRTPELAAATAPTRPAAAGRDRPQCGEEGRRSRSEHGVEVPRGAGAVDALEQRRPEVEAEDRKALGDAMRRGEADPGDAALQELDIKIASARREAEAAFVAAESAQRDLGEAIERVRPGRARQASGHRGRGA